MEHGNTQLSNSDSRNIINQFEKIEYIDNIIFNVAMYFDKNKNFIDMVNDDKNFATIMTTFLANSISYTPSEPEKEFLKTLSTTTPEALPAAETTTQEPSPQAETTTHKASPQPVGGQRVGGQPKNSRRVKCQVQEAKNETDQEETHKSALSNGFNPVNLFKFITFFLVSIFFLYQSMDVYQKYKLQYMVDSYEFESFLNMRPDMNPAEYEDTMAINSQIVTNNTHFFENQKAQEELVKWMKRRQKIFSLSNTVTRITNTLGLPEKLPENIQSAVETMINSEYSLPRSKTFKTCYLTSTSQNNNTALAKNGEIQKYQPNVVFECGREAHSTKPFENLNRYGAMAYYFTEIFLPQNLHNDYYNFMEEVERGILSYEVEYNCNIGTIVNIKLAANMVYYVNDISTNLYNYVRADDNNNGDDQSMVKTVMTPQSFLRSKLSHLMYKVMASVTSVTGTSEKILVEYLKVYFEHKAKMEQIRQMQLNTPSKLSSQALNIVSKVWSPSNEEKDVIKSITTEVINSVKNNQGGSLEKHWRYKTYAEFFNLFDIVLKGKEEGERNKSIQTLAENYARATVVQKTGLGNNV